MAPRIMQIDEFVRSFEINRGVQKLLFLGAGASISSGVPSAINCIWDWKQKIFLSNNPSIARFFKDTSLRSVQERIQQWLDAQGGFPVANSIEEYSFFIEKCFSREIDRRQYFQKIIGNSIPHLGYNLLCHLHNLGQVDSIWTTNFDNLTARAATVHGVTSVEVGMDSAHRLKRPFNKTDLLCVSLHGDYRYDNIKNTEIELLKQEGQLQDELQRRLCTVPSVVIGYSGRDRSVMEVFENAYCAANASMAPLYWCGYGSLENNPLAADLVAKINNLGRDAYYIPTNGFDTLIDRLASFCSQNEREQKEYDDIVAKFNSRDQHEPVPFEIPDGTISSIVKSNVYELLCPSDAFSFDLIEWPQERLWNYLREKTKELQVIAVPFQKKILALGDKTEIQKAFFGCVSGEITRVPINDKDLWNEDGAINWLMRCALIRSIAQKFSLETDGKKHLWQRQKVFQSNGHSFFDTIEIFIKTLNGKPVFVIMPSVYALSDGGEPVPKKIKQDYAQRRLSSQYNEEFSMDVLKWTQIIFRRNKDEKWASFCFPSQSADDFIFKVRAAPICAGLVEKGQSNSCSQNMVQKFVRHKGIIVPEPQLVFANKSQGFTCDPFPIRGMVQNRPYDFDLTRQGVSTNIRIGVVCPENDRNTIVQYLSKLQQRHSVKSNKEYVLDFPGFQQGFGLPIEIPDNDDRLLKCYPVPNESPSLQAVRRLAESIINSINVLHAGTHPNVVLIYIPRELEHYKTAETEHERFDLHDFIKAACVRKGYSTQFLEESTINSGEQCNIKWWLSLALYTKAMRTPWVLDGIDENTAFVGIGFSVNRFNDPGKHVLLGCSHIYSPSGEGLQYRLSKIDEPVFYQRNPFMSKSDAFRLGEGIREMFYQSRGSLPNRVVIHKNTNFTKDEQNGLFEGLTGVQDIEMIEINNNFSIRYLDSFIRRDGSLHISKFPIRRGSTIKIDNRTAFLWIHGRTESATNPKYSYYQGKRRIPSPIIIRRYSGNSSLAQISYELLALSKMDWNTFDLYSKLPATIHTSDAIARVGKYLESFSPNSYDYRLFM